jgi:CheY-like chemotaxis protein
MNQPHLDASHQLSGIRILVVEDEPETLELVSFFLERAGADVRAAASAEAALALLERMEMPHIVMSDLQLPGLGGDELVKMVRARAASSGVTLRAIALSANTLPVDAARALSAGFDVHLAKPVGSEDLVEAVLALAPS